MLFFSISIPHTSTFREEPKKIMPLHSDSRRPPLFFAAVSSVRRMNDLSELLCLVDIKDEYHTAAGRNLDHV